MDGGSRVAAVLKAHHVPVLFTLCGGHISPILVAAKRAGIRIVDVRHEVNAVFAADAFARLTGIPGVAAVTAGPGVANTITAIKNAQMAQSPVVLLGGATATVLRGRGSLQDIDQVSLIAPHVKSVARPNRLKDLIPALDEALHTCRDGVPGPVFVELAVDLLYDEAIVREWYKAKTDKPDKKFKDHAVATALRAHLWRVFSSSSTPVISPPRPPEFATASSGQVTKAVSMLQGAERPVLVVGSQTMLRPDGIPELVSAVERIGVPTYLSGMGRGLLGAGHDLQRRHKRANALKEADVVVLCGVPADFRLDYGAPLSRAKVIAVNLDRDDLVKNRRPDLGILADPHNFLVSLGRGLTTQPDRSAWLAKTLARDAGRDAEIREMAQTDGEWLNPLQLAAAMDDQLADNSILVGDGGDFVASVSYVARPRRPLGWLDPGVFGTLGVGAGFALGAKVVHPESDVWLVWGDGAAGFSLLEMDTAARHQLPFVAVVGNDGGWTQIMRDQVPILGDDVGTVLARTAYHTVADGLGGKGFLVKDMADLSDTLTKAVVASRGGIPTLVNAWLGRSDFRKGSLSM